MICAIDVGNTRVKACLVDEELTIINKSSWSTPDLFEPENWDIFFEYLEKQNSKYAYAEKRISCVSWKAYLALMVYLGYTTEANFNPNQTFDPDLMLLPMDSPILFEGYIPLNMSPTEGMIGSDRLLAAYAAYRIFGCNMVVTSFGTATTIDMVTNNAVFLSGVISPGIDVSYQGLINRATHLPALSELTFSDKALNNNTVEALYAGLYLGQALQVEAIQNRLIEESAIVDISELVLTGGRAYSISSHIRNAHSIVEDLAIYGLALVPAWNDTMNTLSVDLSTLDMSKFVTKKTQIDSTRHVMGDRESKNA